MLAATDGQRLTVPTTQPTQLVDGGCCRCCCVVNSTKICATCQQPVPEGVFQRKKRKREVLEAEGEADNSANFYAGFGEKPSGVTGKAAHNFKQQMKEIVRVVSAQIALLEGQGSEAINIV